jgi:hypothetical protein
MTSGLIRELRAWLLRPTIVHRLPGRLRLRIGALKRLSAQQRELTAVWQGLLTSPPQIQSVDVSHTTGSILIGYDETAIAEREVLAFLANVNRFVLRYWDRLAATPTAQLPKVLRRLRHEAQRGLRQRPALDTDFEISDDVWK